MKSLLIFIGTMLFLSITTFSQIGLDTYTITRNTGITFTSISGSGTAVTGWKNGTEVDDNLSTAITIPFSFPFDGGFHNSMLVSLNGFLTFNTTTYADGADIPACGDIEPYTWENAHFTITGKLGSHQAIAPYYNDLVCNNALNASIYYTTTGSSPNRVFTIQWTNMYNNIYCDDNSCTITPGSLNFQVKLYETSGNIDFIYGTMTQTSWSCSGYSCNIDNTYTSGINSNSISATPTINQLITQQAANTNTFNNTPNNNLTTLPATSSNIIFTRTTPAAPSATPTAISINYPLNNSTLQCLNSTLSWTEGSQNPTSFQVYFGTSATPPLVATITNTYYNPGILAINTTYYWKIVPINGLGTGTSSPVCTFSTGNGDVQPTEIVLTGIGFLESHVPDGTDALGRTIYFNTYAVCRDDVGVGTLTPQNYYLSDGSSLNWTNPIIICGAVPALTCEDAIPNSDLFSSSCEVSVQTPAITFSALMTAILGNALCLGVDPYIEYDVFTRGCNQNVGCTKVRFHILPDPVPGTVQNTGQTICSGGDPSSFGFQTLPDANYGSFSYQWYSYNGNTTAPTGSSVPAGWTAIAGANGSNNVYIENFINAPAVPTGWAFTSIGANVSCYGTNAPAAEFNATNDRIVTTTYSGPITNIKFQYGATSYALLATSSLKFEAYNGSWTQINNYTGLNGDAIFGCNMNQADFTFSPALNYTQFRWTSTVPNVPFSGPSLVLDDVVITEGLLPTYDPPAGLTTTTTYACLISPITGSGLCANILWAAEEWVVTVTTGPPAPTVTTPINYCQNAVASQLTASGTNLLWYTVATGGVGSSTAPTPLTTTVGTTNYWVSQTTTCEGIRAQITVNVNPNVTPTFIALGPYCVGAIPDVLPTTSTNSITGTWNPATISTGSAGITTYTFTPSVGVCAIVTTLNVTVNAVSTIALTSASGTDAQSICESSSITIITYSIGGSGTGAGVTGLPAGLTGSYASGVFTISGTPTVSGIFNYTVTTTGICNPQPTATGTITIDPNATIALTSATGTDVQTICESGAIVNITYSVGGGGTSASVTGLPTGVTGSFAGGVFTITGTPTETGIFNYTISTTGTCTQTSATGTITIIPNPTISLSSATGTDIQTICEHIAITNITYAVGGSATSASVTGLPAGVTGSYAGGVFTITGSPTVAGTFNYTVTTIGSCSPQPTATGTITVNPDATIVLSSPSGTNAQTVCINNPITGITYSVGGGGTSAGVTGLPTGVTGSYVGGIFTITGTPTVSGTFNYTVTTTGTCAQTTAIGTITINPAAIVNAGPNQTICANLTVTLAGSFGGSATSATWSTGGSGTFSPNATTLNAVYTPSASDIAAGSVTLTLTTTGPCSAVNDQITISFNQMDNASFTYPSLIFCQNGTDPAATITGLSGGAFTSTSGLVFLSTLTGTIDLSASTAGTYTITYTTNGTCPNTSTISITINSTPTPQITGTMTVCEGYTYNYSTTNINGHIYTWTITNGSPATATSATVDITWGNAQTGILHLTETIANANCSSSDSEVVVIRETPVAIASSDATVCHGTGITINATSSIGSPPLYYVWNQSLGTGATQNIIPLENIVYTVTVSNADNCSSTDSVTITVYPIPEFSIAATNATCDDYSDGTASATIISASQPVALLWSNGLTVANLTHLGVGVYYLTITDGTGCATIDSVQVNSLDQFNCLEIPTLFSPNEDGKNDKFEIKHIDLYPGAKVEIYNRWGNLLYKSDNYANPSNWWDGTFKGKEVAMGSYVFIITLSPSIEPIQGVVSIAR